MGEYNVDKSTGNLLTTANSYSGGMMKYTGTTISTLHSRLNAMSVDQKK